jgi:hypothetical protein
MLSSFTYAASFFPTLPLFLWVPITGQELDKLLAVSGMCLLIRCSECPSKAQGGGRGAQDWRENDRGYDPGSVIQKG